MKRPCHNQGCPGEYESERVLRAMRLRDRIIVVDGVPAEVCDLCGSTLFAPDVVATLDRIVRTPSPPQGMVPLYSYPAESLPALQHQAVALGAGEDGE
jgi:YgiT-type zinc finger domain-containing protein